MEIYQEKLTQEGKVLKVLRAANGGWVSGRYLIQTMMLSQAHARIFGLQRKGHNIKASTERDSWGFKSYRLIEPVQEPATPAKLF